MAEVVQWIDPDGAPTTLSVKWALRGRFAPPIRMDEQDIPDQPGARLNAVRHGVTEFALPFHVKAASDVALRASLRALIAAMDPTRGTGRIRVTAPGGDQREIYCRCSDGLELEETLGTTSSTTYQLVMPTFRAHDPYWYDVSETVSDYTIGTAASFFPIFPLRLSSSEVFADATVSNVGDVETWPVWTITGPGSGINLRNLTTSKLTTVNTITLGAGETVTIDTRPGQKLVTRNDGANLFPYLSTTSSLWSLIRGANQVRVEMGGATASSSVRLSRKHRYLSP